MTTIAPSNVLARTDLAVVAGTAIVGTVLLESTVAPWAPFFYIGAAITLAVPLLAGTTFGRQPIEALRGSLTAWLAALVVILILDVLLLGPMFDFLAAAATRSGHAIMPLSAAVEALLEKAARTQGLDIATATAIYLVFYLLWAPFAEELFYRGYLQQAFSRRLGAVKASLVSAAFFGLRHVTHLIFLAPDTPWIAALAWGLVAFLGGLIFSWLVRRTGSLWPAVVVHLVVNVAGLAA